ncbi:MAG: HAMP domain-containing sensor histidine kinase [Acidaminobacteraceae bacterium]
MKKICKNEKSYNSVLMIRTRIFTIWVLTLILPLLVIVAYNFVLPGGSIITEGLGRLDEQVWQIDGFNIFNKSNKYFNNIILENPDDVLNLEKHRENISNRAMYDDHFVVLIKKNEELILLNDLDEDETDYMSSKFRDKELPQIFKFKNDDYSFNRELRDKTGYVVNNQIDFYFNDGDEGSIYYLVKYADVESIITKFVIRNFSVFMALMFLFITHLVVKLTTNLTKTINNFIYATEELSRSNLSHRIPKQKKQMLGEIIDAYNRALDELEEIEDDRVKNEEGRQFFIDSLSHDIKTPLTSIEVNADAIVDGVFNTEEKRIKALKIIKDKTRTIDRMIEELKVFNDIYTGRNTYVFEKVGIAEFFEDVIEEYNYEMHQKNIEVKLDLKDFDNVVASIDIYKFKRVIGNILLNSYKYNKGRELCVVVKLRKYKDDIFISIEDNGVGVSDDKLEFIFDRFYRVDSSRTPKNSGSGLGLSISKAIIESHYGEIRAYNSKLGGLGIEIKLNVNELEILREI